VSTDPRQDAAPRHAWWREWEVAGLLLLVVAAYFLRAGALPLRGEESTRAQIAYEMVYWGDWLVPRVQGEPFRIRPPLQNWVNAGCCLILGTWDVYAIRLPSVLATLATTLLIYGYSRVFLTRLGAFTAATAFATMADMFKMGLYAETEPLFILLVSASLLVWHWGFLRQWPDALTYAAGYGLMALATLTKGIQAPPYFLGGIAAFLLLSGQWRRLFCWGHLIGGIVGAAILLAWVIPYGCVMGWPAVREVWLGDQNVQVSQHVVSWDTGVTAIHLVTYPLEVAAATLPWSLLLLVFLSRAFRQAIRDVWPQVFFLMACMAVAWPTCWIPPGGLPRYFAPLFPCLAVLIGLAVERCTLPAAVPSLRAAWLRYSRFVAWLIFTVALVVVALAAGLGAVHPLLQPLVEPLPVAVAYAVIAGGLAVLLLRVSAESSAVHARLAVLALATFLVLTFTGLIMNVRVRRSVDAASDVARLKEKLPPGQTLVSLDGQVDSLFNYLYRLPIIMPRRCPPFGNDPASDVTYFCVSSHGDRRPRLPFAWEEIGVVNLDRNARPVPENVIVVGRRLPASYTPSSAPGFVPASHQEPRTK
jgi:4-amino-4-deoxy-L-arabinose transferase-like glycosyltransferase